MKVLVIGGAGFIGSHVVDALVAQGLHVRVLDNLARGQTAFLSGHLADGKIEFIHADIRDLGSLRSAVHSVAVVFHLAAQSNVMGALADLDYSFSTNVAGTLNVLRASQEAQVRRVVFTSSREVYGDAMKLPVEETHPLNPKNAYGASKVAAEAYCKIFATAAMEVAVLRLANVYGPRDTDRVMPIFIRNALEGRPLVLYGGEQVIDFVWIGDVVEALLAAGFQDNWPATQPVNVGSGVAVGIRELAERVLRVTQGCAGIEVVRARSPEVIRFVADVSRLREHLRKPVNQDPLSMLPAVAEYWKARMDPAHPKTSEVCQPAHRATSTPPAAGKWAI